LTAPVHKVRRYILEQYQSAAAMAGNDNTPATSSSQTMPTDDSNTATMQLLLARIEQLESQQIIKAVKPKSPEPAGTL
jgi:hypothetical protein